MWWVCGLGGGGRGGVRRNKIKKKEKEEARIRRSEKQIKSYIVLKPFQNELQQEKIHPSLLICTVVH